MYTRLQSGRLLFHLIRSSTPSKPTQPSKPNSSLPALTVRCIMIIIIIIIITIKSKTFKEPGARDRMQARGNNYNNNNN